VACCVIAAFILAQCVETLRRWGMYWGIVSIPPGEQAATLLRSLRTRVRSPRVRRAVSAMVAIEFVAVGSWVYFEHGEHIAHFADIAWSRLHGQEVIYAERCATNGRTTVRLVLNELPATPRR
jgi:hypothetical protein